MMTKPHTIAALVVGFALVTVSTVAAQTTMATLRGRIADEQGGALRAVIVSIRHIATGGVHTVVTSETGEYFVPNLPAGAYELAVELAGFNSQRRTGLTMQVGEVATVDIILALGGIQETVDIVGAATLLETTKTTLGSVIDIERIDSLPVVNRDFSSLALLAPGVSAGIGGYAAGGTGQLLSINGQRAFTNNVVVDGASAMWHLYGKQAFTFPQDWIQEFQVLTSSFAPEFGTASGGIINVITRSGSNRVSGRAYGFFRDARFDAGPFTGEYAGNGDPIFLDDAAPFSQRRWGGFLSGPIRRSRAFFFAGYESLLTEATDLLGISDYWRSQGLRTAIPTKTTDHPFVVKADVELTGRHRASVRFDRSTNMKYNQPSTANPALQTEGARQTFGGPVWTIVGNLTSMMSNGMFSEGRVAFMSNRPPILCNQAGAGGSKLLELGPAGTFSRRMYPGAVFGCGFTGLEAEQNLTLIENLSFTRGRHQFKVGAQGDRVRTIIDSLNARNGSWGFPRDLSFDMSNPGSYPDTWSGGLSTPNYSLPTWNLGVFSQDSWRARNDLTLNIGVRYDVDYAATIANEFVDAKNERLVRLAGGDPPIGRQEPDRNNVAPRIGIAWRPGSSETTLVRGAVGWFYDMNHNNYTITAINQSYLTEASISLSANNSLLNPFYNSADPAGSAATLRRFLAQAFPYWPDLSRLPVAKQMLWSLAGLRVPYTRQYTVGLNRLLPFGVILNADLVVAQGVDGIVVVNDNVALTDGRYMEPDPRFAVINHLRNLGWTRYRALQTQMEYRTRRGFLGVAYTLGRATSNYITTILGGAATNPLDLSEDEGPDNSDRGQSVITNGSYLLPFDVQVAGVYSYRGAARWSVTTRFQLDADPFGDRPEPRSSRRGDAQKDLDVRLSKIIRFGGQTRVSVFWEMFNALNTRNFTNYEGSLQSANFGRPLAALPMRRQQLGLRMDF